MTAEQKLEDLINETYPVVKIGYLEFDPAKIVQELDPIAWRCMVADSGFEDDEDED